jgi:hypothetical protein
MKKFARRCDLSWKGMNSGHVFGDGDFYITDDKELFQGYIDKNRNDYQYLNYEDKDVMTMGIEELIHYLYEHDIFYFTEWEEITDDFYYDEHGNEYHEVTEL